MEAYYASLCSSGSVLMWNYVMAANVHIATVESRVICGSGNLQLRETS